MKDLIEIAAAMIDQRFNPTVKDGFLKVQVPGHKNTITYYQEKNNDSKITDNFRHYTPEELKSYLLNCESFFINNKNLNVKNFLELIGKKIKFSYNDFDSGLVKGIGFIKDIKQNKSLPNQYDVEMENIEGDSLYHVYVYKKNDFVMAGDDSDEVFFRVLE